MDDGGGRTSWAAVVVPALLAGVIFFLLVTLVDHYLFGEDFGWDAAGSTIAVTVVWIGVGAAQRQGWMPYPTSRRDEERRLDRER
ncbi:hypothetical protein SAMN05660485_00682 [Blastococcus fimeti]|nr:hypothetical protein SAMN05660485_00682 [Blastococcus fimeti]